MEVHGPLARLDEVQIAIGGLENFVISIGIDERYDGDDESDGNTEDEVQTESKDTGQTANNIYPNVNDERVDRSCNSGTDIECTKPNSDCIIIESDCKPLNCKTSPKPIITIESEKSSTDSTPLLYNRKLKCFTSNDDLQRRDDGTSTDTTPLLDNMKGKQPKMDEVNKSCENDNVNEQDNDTSDTTPLLVRIYIETRQRKKPKRLFTAAANSKTDQS